MQSMEDLKLLMDDIMKNREEIDQLKAEIATLGLCHNNLVEEHTKLKCNHTILTKKHNMLCIGIMLFGGAMVVKELIAMKNTMDISEEKENKEG